LSGEKCLNQLGLYEKRQNLMDAKLIYQEELSWMEHTSRNEKCTVPAHY